ncbi:MAG TPA: hypothetical protein VGI43_07520 [Mucilaginibacter sp.]|jgi:hypothetical protein
MEKLTIKFLIDNGWMEYDRFSDAPNNCFFKNRYPVALWWDDVQFGFWVIYLNDLTRNPIIQGKDFMQTIIEYDALIMPILQMLEAIDRS